MLQRPSSITLSVGSHDPRTLRGSGRCMRYRKLHPWASEIYPLLIAWSLFMGVSNFQSDTALFS